MGPEVGTKQLYSNLKYTIIRSATPRGLALCQVFRLRSNSENKVLCDDIHVTEI